ncbi:rod shape-determining protein MreC [Thermomonas sp.]|uniref:rod shape-determining protein MreC n=1 Tax=Thermomonas sp. TaxID=1971895 RepID=UPI0039E6ACC5
MSFNAGSHAARHGDVAGVLRLLAFLVAAVALMLLDHRGGWLHALRTRAETAVQPLWWLASVPSRVGGSLREDAVTRAQLARDNERLRNATLVLAARNARLRTAAAENARLRALLGSAERGRLDVQLVSILGIDLDPTRQRLLLDAGSIAGVQTEQVVIDAGGLLGQVISTTPSTATVLLLTDPDHAVPVMVARSGVRLIVYGAGRSDALRLADVPLSADVREGDELLTSGLGGRFPPGFAVGKVGALRPDDSRAFLEAEVTPAAQLDRGSDVLLLRGYIPPIDVQANDVPTPAAPQATPPVSTPAPSVPATPEPTP